MSEEFYIDPITGEYIDTSLMAPPSRGGTGWAKSVREWLAEDDNLEHGNILPAAASIAHMVPFGGFDTDVEQDPNARMTALMQYLEANR